MYLNVFNAHLSNIYKKIVRRIIQDTCTMDIGLCTVASCLLYQGQVVSCSGVKD